MGTEKFTPTHEVFLADMETIVPMRALGDGWFVGSDGDRRYFPEHRYRPLKSDSKATTKKAPR